MRRATSRTVPAVKPRGGGAQLAAWATALTVATLTVAALAVGGCSTPGDPSASVGASQPPNLILVVVDTLRADRLGMYGYPRPTSPHLDRLATQSAVFTQARAQAPCTFPSANSLLTSRPTWTFAGRPEGHLGIPPDIPTVASHLGRAGYRTAAVSASPVVRKRPSDLNREGGFDAGFDLFLDSCEWRDARCVHRQAQPLLDLLPEPFFLYLHYLDPHDPYRAPEGKAHFAGPAPEDATRAVAEGDPLPAARRLYRDGDAALSASEVAHLSDRYDEEVAWVDAWIGELVQELERRALLERSVLVVTSDHGESFLEHGHLRHCRSLYDEELRVPLLIRPPGGASEMETVPGAEPPHLDQPVALLDVTPTLLDFAGALQPAAGWAGQSLRPWLVGRPGKRQAGQRAVTAASGTRRSLMMGRFKLIHDLNDDPVSPTSRLFDLRSDPGEERDLATQRPRITQQLRQRLDRHLRAVEETGLDAGARHLDRSREAERQLRALGYLH